MSPWADVLERIQARDADGMARLVTELDAPGRRQIATELPGYLQQLRRGRWEGPRDLTAEAPALRVAGAACLTGTAQVAGWLSHRDLRVWRSLEDPDRIVAVLRHRPEPWRADLARRLVPRLFEADGAPEALAYHLRPSRGSCPANTRAMGRREEWPERLT